MNSIKPSPTGIVSLSRGIQEEVADIHVNRQSWQSTCVSGVRIGIPWGSIETARGAYDFSIIDAALNLAKQNDKRLSFTVKMGYFTPKWVYSEGVALWSAISGPDLGTMPLPWDPIYLDIVREFTNALGDRFDQDPALSYIQMQGFAQSGELYCANSEPDNSNLIKLGGIPTWLDAAKKITRFYMNAFPRTPLFVALARPFLYSAGVQAEKDYASWGTTKFLGHFGVMCNSLSCRSDTGYYPNQAVHDYRPSGFQMVCTARDVERMSGTLEQALDNGIDIGGQFFEVYYQDVQNPAYQPMLADKNAWLRGYEL